jgi:hypothetical protein
MLIFLVIALGVSGGATPNDIWLKCKKHDKHSLMAEVKTACEADSDCEYHNIMKVCSTSEHAFKRLREDYTPDAAVAQCESSTPHDADNSIAVIVLATPEVFSVSKDTLPLLHMYCKKHGYTLIVETKQLDESRHVVWSKIRHLHNFLHRYKRVVLFDNDVIITKYKQRLEPFFDELERENKHIAMNPDCSLTTCWDKSRPSSWFVAATSDALPLVQQWLDDAAGPCSVMANEHPRTQRVLWFCVLAIPTFAKQLHLLPQHTLPTVETLQQFSMALALAGPTRIQHDNGTEELIPSPVLGIHAHGGAKEDGAIGKLAMATSKFVLSDEERAAAPKWEDLKAELMRHSALGL